MPNELSKIIAARHPLYLAHASLWQYFGDAAEGGPTYAGKSNPLAASFQATAVSHSMPGVGRYLTRHPLEDGADYVIRVSKCPTVNVCAPAIDLLAGTVGAPDSVVFDVGPDYQFLLDDADLAENSLSQFMSHARARAAVLGHAFVLCDSSRAKGDVVTERDVIDQGIRPFYRLIEPSDMLNWRLDESGRPTQILFRVAIEPPGHILDGSDHSEQSYEYRYWDAQKWVVFRQKGEDVVIAGEGPHPIGEIPISVLYHKRLKPFLGESLLKESAKFNQLLTNWLSDLDMTMTQQSFSQACLRSEQKPLQAGVGATRVLHLQPGRKEGDVTYEGEDFFFRAPDAGPLQGMWDSFFRIVDLANSSMSLKPEATTDKSQAESGISRAWKWHSTEKRLITMSMNEQEAVRSMFDHAAAWKGKSEFTGTIQYSTSFDLSALEDDITNMIALQAAGLPTSAQTELKRRVIRKALPNMGPARQAEINTELDQIGSMPMIDDPRQR